VESDFACLRWCNRLTYLINHLEDIAQVSFMTIVMMILLTVVMNRALKKAVNEYRNYRILPMTKESLRSIALRKKSNGNTPS